MRWGTEAEEEGQVVGKNGEMEAGEGGVLARTGARVRGNRGRQEVSAR